MSNILELRQQRASLWDQQKVVLDAADPIKGMTGEQQQAYDRMETDMESVDQTIARMQKHEETQARLGASAGVAARPNPNASDDHEQKDKDVSTAFMAWARGGMESLAPEHRSVMQNRFAAATPEFRAAAGVGTGAGGGYTVPQDFYNNMIEAMKTYGGMRESGATILTTTSGAALPIPTVDDTGNIGALLAENTAAAEQDFTFGQKMLGAHLFTSKIVRVSLQLLQDSAFDLETWLPKSLGTRIGRVVNQYATTGTGSGQPQGVVTGAVSGKVGATGQTVTATYDDLVDLIHSVDPAYRTNGKLMFHDTTLKALKKLKDTTGRPLWAPGIAVREPDTIDGRGYVINQDVPVMAANAKSMLFGDFSVYFLRDVKDITVIRLQERYADFMQVGFIAYSRHDGLLADAGAGSIKFYQNSAT